MSIQSPKTKKGRNVEEVGDVATKCIEHQKPSGTQADRKGDLNVIISRSSGVSKRSRPFQDVGMRYVKRSRPNGDCSRSKGSDLAHVHHIRVVDVVVFQDIVSGAPVALEDGSTGPSPLLNPLASVAAENLVDGGPCIRVGAHHPLDELMEGVGILLFDHETGRTG